MNYTLTKVSLVAAINGSYNILYAYSPPFSTKWEVFFLLDALYNS